MEITEILKKEHIIEDLNLDDKNGVLDDKNGVLNEFSEFLKKKGAIKDKEALFEALAQREKLGSTGIGENVAIPHAKLDNIDTIITLFARSKKGIEFESLDKKPVHFFCLVIAPANSTGLHLKVLARISKLLKNSSLRDAILNATAVDQIFNILTDEDSKFL